MRSPIKWMMTCAPLLLAGCPAPPVESPSTVVTQETDVRVEQRVKNKVDVLFVIDDSPSMRPKQDELRAKFPQLIKILDDFGAKGNPAHYHIGVVSSDLGAGQSTSSSNCRAGGLGAKLQALGRAHGATCGALGGGVNYIDYNQLNNSNNLPAGQDLATTFGCMAAVGDTGCGFEHTLEAAYRALHDCLPDNAGMYPNCTIPENRGFLRPDSLVAVIFVSDEDDCSAEPTSDLFDLSRTGTYGSLLSFRCTQYGIQCSGNLPPYMDSGGPLSMCVGAANPGGAGPGRLYEVSRYINFFTKGAAQGGLRIDPKDVILAGLTGPYDDMNNPVQTIVANPGTYAPCTAGQAIDGVKCAVVLQRSCSDPTRNQWFGDPGVRMNQVIGSAANTQITSICDQDYTPALQKLGELIVSNIGAGCLTSPVTNPSDPDCVVEDVTTDPLTGKDKVTPIASCEKNGGAAPCWKLQVNDKCTPIKNPANNCQTENFGVGIDRGPGGQPPANTFARVSCATIAFTANACP